MIRVDRSKVDPPPALAAAKATKELAANKKLAKEGRYQEMKFDVYKDGSVKDVLAQLFQGKCAYCECVYVAQQPGDVEHFRPKALVAVRRPNGKVVYKPGYYWLAADWNNLLPSCIDCNRQRKHAIELGAGKRVMGKANWFPVDPESKRAKRASAVAKEPSVLLDPCRDEPAQHVGFDDDGSVKARSPNLGPSPRGQATIEYCALSRLELAQQRNKLGQEVLYVVSNLLKAHAASDSAEVSRHAARLEAMIDTSASYSAYAKAMAGRHLGPHRAAAGL